MSAQESQESAEPESAAAVPAWRCRRGHVTTAPLVVQLRLETTMESMRMIGCPQCVSDFFEDKFGVRRWTQVGPRARKG